MNKYEPQKLIDALNDRITVPSKCPFCGGVRFTSIQQFASISIGEDFDVTTLGPSVPAGLVICKNCGFIYFFSLGVLGLLNNSDGGDENGEIIG